MIAPSPANHKGKALARAVAGSAIDLGLDYG
jgi:hypothetical protein